MPLYPHIKVLLADNQELYRDGFRSMIKKHPDIEMVGEAKNGEELLKAATLLQPDIIITETLLPGMNGAEATKGILKDFPHIGVITLSISNEDNLLIRMIEAGAQGYLLKDVYEEEIIEAIKTVYDGGSYYCKNTTIKLRKLLSNTVVFSEKELTIIKLICNGYSSQEIADQLHNSIRTIDSYRKNILQKMKVKNATGLVLYAIRNNIYNPNEVMN
jgi:DNA-binding NarL/FixJ family response regulator